MAANPQSVPLSGLARALVQAERLKEAEAEAMLAQAAATRTSLIEQIVLAKKATFLEVARFAADKFGYPLLDLAAFDDALIQRNAIDRKLIASHRVVPLHKRGNRLAIAIADPTNLRALDEVRFQTGLAVDPVVVEDNKLSPLVAKLSESVEETLKSLSNDDINLEFTDEQSQDKTDEASSMEVDDAPVVRFIQKMLLDAINEGASDIHFEPYEKSYRIRFRSDGILREVASPPLVIKDKIASRIKVISRLNIAEKRVPQDGRMRLVLSKSRSIDFRVSTLPTMYGEKIVLRILDPGSATLGIDALGYEPAQKATLLDAIHRPYGMILVTGPTGSGKTVSLYTCLNILNQPGVNIATAEDPAEIPLPGINQVNVDDRAGLTFPIALKAFLRQDPDIIMVGEIRDIETAEIAIKAAQTGHLVLSTLHTNDAPATLTRLMNMGIPTFNLASSILLITAQRLVRRLCTCRKPIDAPVQTLLNAGFTEADLDGSWVLYGPGECERCKGSGYKGRVGLYEVMPVTEAIQRIIMANGTELDIAIQARKEGVNDLRRSGLLKVMQGLTSLDEVLGSTNA
ncbi:MAG TPA: type IV-A pilus assembly ATPase PilB [Accumulibacter sp.]|uniref:type IV-A pilus assembly ATPase PilB n=2 Tax=Accumulibacter sp. TaxID=2053492 RepID=UPI002B7B87E8|nr:type IV-A pilus assembly ATPase PilB [Accumulibacter sp.]HMV03947.1 type IV-A pilus assembly ATPase PilB [Accumulibacter sp.]HMW80166.1 type IV-A pilus assembly ATPase PilB [Accumulibacter sp.]HMX69040.1 type IV-A pilus assembly ATPase PilB [Accumulibacter sp.]HNC27758.1 type IV-A pilus assembly ATPase PilB [Accumulibacter sp.]HNE40120.1 type IV-A pilus assembly ATPase PilB [Accumulibacter sp.]